MSNLFKQYKNVFIIVALLAAAFVAYSIFFSGEEEGTLTASPAAPTQTAVEQELISLLLELRGITLETDILTDPRFESLTDFSQELVAEPVGRPNPFAPF